MSSRTILQEFKAEPRTFSNKDTLLEKLSKIGEILNKFDLHPNIPKDKSLETVVCDNCTLFLHYTAGNGSDAILRGHAPDLITLDIHEYDVNDKPTIFTKQVADEIKHGISELLQCKRSTPSLPAIRRGQDIPVYFPTSGGQLVEYDFDRCVFEETSEYQNIKIMHSPQFGNMLLLDDDPNLAESDLAYTHAITGHGHEDYTDKTVLILGGGDGGILHELLKEKPKFITMVDVNIDRIVVEQAVIHLRGICHDSMDNLCGDNYEVLIADCVPILKKYIEENRTFDFVINDLTAIPVTTEPIGDHWEFLKLILDLSMKVLAPTGKYYTQGNGANMVQALDMYEQQLNKLKSPVTFKKQTVCVPSYLEMWVFYEIWKVNEKS